MRPACCPELAPFPSARLLQATQRSGNHGFPYVQEHRWQQRQQRLTQRQRSRQAPPLQQRLLSRPLQQHQLQQQHYGPWGKLYAFAGLMPDRGSVKYTKGGAHTGRHVIYVIYTYMYTYIPFMCMQNMNPQRDPWADWWIQSTNDLHQLVAGV